MKTINFAICVFIFALIGSSCNSPTKSREPIRIAIDQFVGFAPVYLGIENHSFEQRGIKVEALPILDTAERTTALATGRVDAICTTLDSLLLAAGKGVDLVVVFAVDESKGADGILASPSIHNPKDLRGKSVAFQEGMPSHFLLLWVLTANGLEPKDIHQVNMNADAAGAAFVAHKVDAAVTWEPWLSRAKTSNSGHILVSTAQLPGVLVDVLAVRRDFFEKHQPEVQALYEGWMDAIDAYHQAPQTATPIMSKYLKLAPDEFQQNASGLRFADRTYNKQFFSHDSPNSAWLLANKADQIWKAANLLPQSANSSKFITDAIVLNSSTNQR